MKSTRPETSLQRARFHAEPVRRVGDVRGNGQLHRLARCLERVHPQIERGAFEQGFGFESADV